MPRRKHQKKLNISEIERYVAITMGALVVLFIIAQFVVLDLAGIHGPEITNLRQEQEELKLDNDLKRAKINELKTSQNIKSYAEESLGLVQKNVEIIEVTNNNSEITAFDSTN